MRERITAVSFTERGARLAERICAALGGAHTEAHGDRAFSLEAWTRDAFVSGDALLFVGAAGIAVRAIAPYVKSKAEDPAVLCVDELGRFVIPLLSGHLGGANALARRVADVTGGTAVITTATDLNGAFAVDLWAVRQDMAVLQPERIKTVSSAILRGESIRVTCPWPIGGAAPAQVCLSAHGDVAVDVRPLGGEALQLVPRILTLGIGCRRGTSGEELETVFRRFCAERRIVPKAIAAAASIDRKRDETGLLTFCERHGWPVTFYTADALAAVKGAFSASAFVASTVGVDNVCERAAVLAGGELFEKKYAADGVTFAVALRTPQLDWSW